MRITWDDPADRLFRAGVDRGVFYLREGGIYPLGVAWNGLSGVDDSTAGREMTALYSGDIRRDYTKTKPERAGTINCYTYPDEMDQCIGGEEIYYGLTFFDQNESDFGFVYRRMIGNAVEGNKHAYEIHILYGCTITGFTDSASTINSDASTDALGFQFQSYPEDVTGYSPVSHVVVRSDRMRSGQMTALEDVLYGTDDSAPYLPLPDELIALLRASDYAPEYDAESTYEGGLDISFSSSADGSVMHITSVDVVSSYSPDAGLTFSAEASGTKGGSIKTEVDVPSDFSISSYAVAYESSADAELV